eukprot:3844194-Rhodomonas_salina.2
MLRRSTVRELRPQNASGVANTVLRNALSHVCFSDRLFVHSGCLFSGNGQCVSAPHPPPFMRSIPQLCIPRREL